MDWEQILKTNGLDRYDRNARLYPALLCLLPLFAVVALWLPAVWSLLGGLVSLAVGCGLIFFLAQIIRYLGRQVEKRLGDRVGRGLSAVLLSHNDLYIPPETKARYHAYLRKHGIAIPDRDQEARDPAAAKRSFLSAVDWLLEHTRASAKASMLHNENIAYGFRRNLLGVKAVGLIVLLGALAGNGFLLAIKDDQTRMLAASIVEFFMLLALAAWLFIVRPPFVEDASLAYVQRFLAQCENPAPRKRGTAPANSR